MELLRSIIDLFIPDCVEVTFEQRPDQLYHVVRQVGLVTCFAENNDLRLVLRGRGAAFVITDGMKRITVERKAFYAVSVTVEQAGHPPWIEAYKPGPVTPCVFYDAHARFATVTRYPRSRLQARPSLAA